MSLWKKIGLTLVVATIIIQFIQPARNNSGQVLSVDIENRFFIPPKVQNLLINSCYDCHSNNTNYPWYANIQPIGWLLSNHIKNGKKELNFSEFGFYSTRRQQSKLKAIADQLTDDAMPLYSYIWLHKNAKLSKENKGLIIDWANRTKDSIELEN